MENNPSDMQTQTGNEKTYSVEDIINAFAAWVHSSRKSNPQLTDNPNIFFLSGYLALVETTDEMRDRIEKRIKEIY